MSSDDSEVITTSDHELHGDGDASSKQEVKISSDAVELDDEDAEIEAMKQRIREMEEEAAKGESQVGSAKQSSAAASIEAGPEQDARSIYVGNVDYSTTPEELQEYFSSCGTVNHVTILCDKFTGHPKGFAYLAFKDVDAVQNALLLNESEFKGRLLKISPKRTNVPGLKAHVPGVRGVPRGRGRGRGRAPMPYYAPYPPPPPMYYPTPYGYGPAPRPRFRSRRATFSPY